MRWRRRCHDDSRKGSASSFRPAVPILSPEQPSIARYFKRLNSVASDPPVKEGNTFSYDRRENCVIDLTLEEDDTDNSGIESPQTASGGEISAELKEKRRNGNLDGEERNAVAAATSSSPHESDSREPADGCIETGGRVESCLSCLPPPFADPEADLACISALTFPEGRPIRRFKFMFATATLRLLLPLRICLDAGTTHLSSIFQNEERKALERLACLLGVPPLKDASSTAASASSFYFTNSESGLTYIPKKAGVSSEAAEGLCSARHCNDVGGGPLERSPLNSPLSPGAQLLFARLLSHLLRSGVADEDPFLSVSNVPPPWSQNSDGGSKNRLKGERPRLFRRSWVRLPPLLRRLQEVPCVEDALRELLERRVIVVWLNGRRFPASETENKPPTVGVQRSACRDCRFCIDGSCSCVWTNALRCLSADELASLAVKAKNALRAAGREGLAPRRRLKGRDSLIAFLQSLAAGHAWKEEGPTQSNALSIRSFFSVVTKARPAETAVGKGGELKFNKDVLSLAEVSRCIREGLIEILGCAASVEDEASWLNALRLAFLATHSVHAAALGSVGRHVPSYVLNGVSCVGPFGMDRGEEYEERLIALGTAAILPSVQRISHIVDGQLRVRPLTQKTSSSTETHAASPEKKEGSSASPSLSIKAEEESLQDETGNLPDLWRCFCFCCEVRRSRGTECLTRASLLAYVEAWLLQLRVHGLLSSDCPASQDEALSVASEACSSIRQWLARRRLDTEASKETTSSLRGSDLEVSRCYKTDAFLLRFTAPYAWASIVSKCISLLEQREEYGLAAERLQLLIDLHQEHLLLLRPNSNTSTRVSEPDLLSPFAAQNSAIPGNGKERSVFSSCIISSLCKRQSSVAVFSHRVGGWYDRLTLLQQRLGCPYVALKTAVRCLCEDPPLSLMDRRALAKRACRMAAALYSRKKMEECFSWEIVQKKAMEERDSKETSSIFILDDNTDDNTESSSESESDADAFKPIAATKTRGSRILKPKRGKTLKGAGKTKAERTSEIGQTVDMSDEKELFFAKRPWLSAFPEQVRAFLQSDALEISSLDEKLNFEIVEGRPLRATQQSGKSSVFVGWSEALMRVEALALEHYFIKGKWRGTHDEGGCLRSILLVLMAWVVQEASQSKTGGWTNEAFAGPSMCDLQTHLQVGFPKPSRSVADATVGSSPKSLMRSPCSSKGLNCESLSVQTSPRRRIGKVNSPLQPTAELMRFAFLPPLSPDVPFLQISSVQLRLQALLRSLLASSPAQVYAQVKRAVLAMYGQPIRGVQWRWGSSDLGTVSYESDDSAKATEEPLAFSSFAEQDPGASQKAFACADFLANIAAGVGPRVLVSACLLLTDNFRIWSGGLPDLLLWRRPEKATDFNAKSHSLDARTEQSETEKVAETDALATDSSEAQHITESLPLEEKFIPWEIKFVEVKGPRDRLSERQRCWLARLLEAGGSCEVCRVLEPDTADRMRRRSVRSDLQKNGPSNKRSNKSVVVKQPCGKRARRVKRSTQTPRHSTSSEENRETAPVDVDLEPDASASQRLSCISSSETLET